MLKKVFKLIVRAMKGKLYRRRGEFFARIQHRHSTFWDAPNAEAVRNTPMSASDPLAKWQDVENWQRKLSNKYNSREFAKMNGCRVAELYWKGRDLSTLDVEKLPKQFVIRPTIGYSSNLVFVIDGSFNLMDQQTYTKQDIIEKLGIALQQNPYLEFLVEEFLKTERSEYKLPIDYKFFMFNGEVAYIFIIDRLSPTKGYSTFYDENWKQIDNPNTYYPKGTYQQPPVCLAEMIEQAKKLSRLYGIFVRIDFYATDKGAVFGEFTPTPFMGTNFTPAGEQMLIDYWDKYCKGMI
ncbi:hypothetical protein I2I11_05810 [Pontibacter sp. 172403-2]|uniref:ATP-grasp fold amidoligase family protein n=1 Tax=Pontibacter rufus TaxID=2791028 RepID=UPI0018AFB5F5|nr:ATP-grasp fold amidoligase family protein [Pontibacter sp. 172403-2]MBF9252796.1 hypothetical protein [Pontibacter sp. 172403-2]